MADNFHEVMDRINAYCMAEQLKLCPNSNSVDSYQAGILQAWIAMLLTGLMTLEDIRKKLGVEK